MDARGTLLEPAELGPVELSNRIMSSGHQTTLVEDYRPTEAFFDYHLARARGGVGLVVLEAHAVHESGLLTAHTIDASRESLVDDYRGFPAAMREAGCRVFAQLFHGGRERYAGEYAPPAVSASDAPTARLRVVPRPLETDEVREIIDAYVDAAARMERAGFDGVEVVGSHSYLPAQFWSPKVNDRADEYGGSRAARCRFTTEIIRRVRERTGDGFAVGVRLSAEERSPDGLSFEETLPIVTHIDGAVDVDYWSVVVGSSSSRRGSSYIVPPATESSEVVRTPAAAIDRAVDPPTVVTSRLNTPETAARAVEADGAEVVGMTRALIADPALPRKLRDGETDDVTPCVACNQGCIGRYQEGLSIRCTVNPVTGRETDHADLDPAADPREVLVVGGGPAGLVTAATAAARSHDVTLVEADDRLGGQVRAYADLDHRGRFGDWIDTLAGRLDDRGVTVRTGERVGPADVRAADPDAVVLATGATGRIPDVPIDGSVATLTAREALADPPGGDVVVSDWDGNHAALDAAVAVDDAGGDVEVVTAAETAGANVQQYVRNSLLGELSERGVALSPHRRVAAVRDGAAVVEHELTGARERRRVDAVAFAHRGEADYGPFRALRDGGIDVRRVGDCWAPRSLDEAVREGFDAAVDL